MSVPIPLRVDFDAAHPSGTRDSSRRSGPTFNTASAAATRLAATLACDLRATLRGRRITAGPRFRAGWSSNGRRSASALSATRRVQHEAAA
jgi:hypothetical protein